MIIIESKVEDYTRVVQPFNVIKDETFEAEYHKENVVHLYEALASLYEKSLKQTKKWLVILGNVVNTLFRLNSMVILAHEQEIQLGHLVVQSDDESGEDDLVDNHP